MKTKIFNGTLPFLTSMLSWIEEEIKPHSSEGMGLVLACEEALVNIINHGYGGKGGPIEISIQIDKEAISIRLKDDAPSFNPLLLSSAIDNSLTLEERKEGGLGIPIMRKYADEILYKREGNRNILTLKKKRTNPTDFFR